jgi:hypothetical protein
MCGSICLLTPVANLREISRSHSGLAHFSLICPDQIYRAKEYEHGAKGGSISLRSTPSPLNIAAVFLDHATIASRMV